MRSTRPTLDLTNSLTAVVADLCARLPVFAHVNPRRLLVCLSRSRRATVGGCYAKIAPMRFPGGSLYRTSGGHQYALPQIPTPEGEVLYLIYISTPRFFEQVFDRRLLALIHELYHISPAFDGTIRRIGRGAHGASRASYNRTLEPLVQQYLAAGPPEHLLEVLHSDLRGLSKTTTLIGRTLPLPKPVRLD